MEEVKGILQAKDEQKAVQAMPDKQLVSELEKRGYRVDGRQ